ncbi:DYL1 protein, partial [Grus americana]|nr:DYL1 protein [Grus americana]
MGDQLAMIKDTDMSEEMQQDAVECAIQCLEECRVERDIAAHRRRISEFDKKYNPTWHGTVGRDFVPQETSHFILICLGPLIIPLLEGS